MSTNVAPEVSAPVAPVAPVAPDASVDAPVTRGRKKMNKTDYRAKDAPKLKEWPADFNAEVHKPLVVEDFEAEDIFWDHKADEYEKRAKSCRKNADLFRRFGSAEKRKAAAQAVKLSEKLLALKAELEASGITMEDINLDLSALLK